MENSIQKAKSENSYWVTVSPLWRPLLYVQGPCTFPPGLRAWSGLAEGVEGTVRAQGAGLTSGRVPRRAACWLGTGGAEALDAWWTLRLAGGPAGMAPAVAAVAGVAETETELVSSGSLKSLSGCWYGSAGLGGAKETHDLP